MNNTNQQLNAFTLAEVLITLGVIGVVAAVTMPTLIQNYNKKVTETRLKKFYSTMNQTVERLKVDHGDLKNWDYTVNNLYDDEGNLLPQSEAVAAKFEEFFGKYIDFVDKNEVDEMGNARYIYYLKDGSAVMPAWYNNFDYEYFPKNPKKCLEKEKTSRYGICSFSFQFYPNIYAQYRLYKGFTPYSSNLSRNDLPDVRKSKMYTNCQDTGGNCGLIIMLNNWTVPDDYPRKLAY